MRKHGSSVQKTLTDSFMLPRQTRAILSLREKEVLFSDGAEPLNGAGSYVLFFSSSLQQPDAVIA